MNVPSLAGWRAVTALIVLNASLTFENVWPTPRIRWSNALSIELAVLVLLLALVPPSANAQERFSSLFRIAIAADGNADAFGTAEAAASAGLPVGVRLVRQLSSADPLRPTARGANVPLWIAVAAPRTANALEGWRGDLRREGLPPRGA